MGRFLIFGTTIFAIDATYGIPGARAIFKTEKIFKTESKAREDMGHHPHVLETSRGHFNSICYSKSNCTDFKGGKFNLKYATATVEN